MRKFFHCKKIKSAALTMAIAFTTLALPVKYSNAAIYSDLKDYEWAEPAIIDMYNKNIIKGFTDGTFRPKNDVSRIEIIAMLSRLYSQEAIDKVINSMDKSEYNKYESALEKYKIEPWARKNIIFAIKKGIIPDTDKMLRNFVDQKTGQLWAAKRYEVCVFMVNALNIQKEMNKNASLNYKDNSSIIGQSIPYIELLQRKGILSENGDGHGYFHPNKGITRAETAVMISRAYKYSPILIPEKAQEPKETKTISGKINLVTLSGDLINISIKEDTGKITDIKGNKDITIEKNGKSLDYKALKVGTTGDFFLSDNKLTKVILKSKDIKIKGEISKIDKSNDEIIIKDDGFEYKVYFDENSQFLINDEKSSVKDLKAGMKIALNASDNVIEKATIILDEISQNVEITDYDLNKVTFIDKSGKTIEKPLSKNIKIYKNEKEQESISNLAVGDKATIVEKDGALIEISVNTKKEKYIDVVIKSIEMNKNYNKITITDNDNKDHILQIGNDTIIRIKGEKRDVYSLKIGYKADIFTDGALIEEINTRGDYKKSTISGKVSDVDLVDKFIKIETDNEQTVKAFYDIDTKIEKYLSSGEPVKARAEEIDDHAQITAIGILEGGDLKAFRIIVGY